jgi:large subunit ribosomal protein L24
LGLQPDQTRLHAQAASLWGDAGFMNRIKFHVRKGDNVEVISGNFKGSSGKILEVIARKQQVLVEGVRIIKKHLRKSQDNPQGKIAEREGPIHISNVKFLERETKTEKKTKKKPEKKPENKAA